MEEPCFESKTLLLMFNSTFTAKSHYLDAQTLQKSQIWQSKNNSDSKVFANSKTPLWQKNLVLTKKISLLSKYTFIFYLFGGQLKNKMMKVQQAIHGAIGIIFAN